jgi:transposase
MTTPPAGISEADWAATPVGVRVGFLEVLAQLQRQHQENDQLRVQLTALATEVANLRERIGRNSRNSSKPPSSDGAGFKPPTRRKGTGRKRGGQQGHPGAGPELLPIERVDEVVEHHPDACRRCGTLLQGEDPEPLRHQVIEIPPITAVVIEHRLHRLVCPCCSTSTCAELPVDVEPSRYGPRLSGLVGLLGSAFPLSFGRTQALLDQLLGVEISRGAIATIRARLSAALQQAVEEALEAARQQPVAYVDETGAPTGNAAG